MKYFEDFTVGTTHHLGSKTVTAEEIVRFAREFDPHWFHTDPEAAKEHAFGGLVASGIHTFAIFTSLFYSLMGDAANLGGLDAHMHWRGPVRPLDTLTGRVIVLETIPSRSKPDRGVVKFRMELENQDGEIVWDALSGAMLARRP